MHASRESIRQILTESALLRGRPYRIDRIYLDDPEENCFRLDLIDENTSLKLRLASPRRAASLFAEYEALRLLSDRGVSWPAGIIEFRAEAPAYLVSRYAPGESLDKSCDWLPHASSIRHDLGMLLADFGRIAGERFGYLPCPEFTSWELFIDSRLEYYFSVLQRGNELAPEVIETITSIRAVAANALRATCPVFLHVGYRGSSLRPRRAG